MNQDKERESRIRANDGPVWESEVSRKAFFLRGIASITFRVIYFLFSIYWIYRLYYLKAADLFCLMGLFFFLTSLYLLAYPLCSARNTRYALTSKRLIVPGIFGRAIEIPVSGIKKVRKLWSAFDSEGECASFEVEYLAGQDDEASYYKMVAVKKYEELEKALDKLAEKRRIIIRQERGDSPKGRGEKSGQREVKKWIPVVGAMFIVAMIFGFIYNYNRNYLEFSSIQKIRDMGRVYLYAELNRPIEERDLYVGLFGSDYVSCCQRVVDNSSLLLFYSYENYDRTNLTIYLFDRFTEKPAIEKSKEYITKVYLCVSKGVPIFQNRAISKIFGDEKISKSSCRYTWSWESCCIDWATPG